MWCFGGGEGLGAGGSRDVSAIAGVGFSAGATVAAKQIYALTSDDDPLQS